MPIYFDPTEARSGTRLPKSVVDQGQALPGLEGATGADLLISTATLPPGAKLPPRLAAEAFLALDDGHHQSPPQLAQLIEASIPETLHLLAFQNAVRSGGVLVQRKSGQDFTSSIPDLRCIRKRMLAWTYRSWLLVTGEFTLDSGKVVVDGRKTGFSVPSMKGAVDAWRLDGGQVEFVLRDDDIPGWLSRQLDSVTASASKGDGMVGFYRRKFKKDDDKARAVAILSSLKNIGHTGAVKLLDYYGSLAGALEAALDPTVPSSRYRPGGVLGKGTVKANRELFGLNGNLGFCLLDKEK